MCGLQSTKIFPFVCFCYKKGTLLYYLKRNNMLCLETKIEPKLKGF